MSKHKLRPMGDITADLEEIMLEMVERQGLQWGEVLAIVHGYLAVHCPEAQEQYHEGGAPEFYYGPRRKP